MDLNILIYEVFVQTNLFSRKKFLFSLNPLQLKYDKIWLNLSSFSRPIIVYLFVAFTFYFNNSIHFIWFNKIILIISDTYLYMIIIISFDYEEFNEDKDDASKRSNSRTFNLILGLELNSTSMLIEKNGSITLMWYAKMYIKLSLRKEVRKKCFSFDDSLVAF